MVNKDSFQDSYSKPVMRSASGDYRGPAQSGIEFMRVIRSEHDELVADRKRLEFLRDNLSNEFIITKCEDGWYYGSIATDTGYSISEVYEQFGPFKNAGPFETFREAIDDAAIKYNVEAAGDAGSVTTAGSQPDRGLNPGQTTAPVAVDTLAQYINFGDDFDHGMSDVWINGGLVSPDESGNYDLGEGRFARINIVTMPRLGHPEVKGDDWKCSICGNINSSVYHTCPFSHEGV